MAAGDFRPARPKVCRSCGAAGEFPGFLTPCPECRGDVERAA